VPPFSSAQEPKLPPELKKVTVADGVELHHVEKGKGVPVIFVHGAGMGYSAWDIHLGPFAESDRDRVELTPQQPKPEQASRELHVHR